MVSQGERDSSAGALVGLDRAVAILESLKSAKGPLTLAEVSRATGLREPTALRYVTALRGHRLVRRDPDTGRYTLGVRLFEFGQHALGAVDPRKAALPVMDKLLERFGETVELAMREGDRLLILEARAGLHSVSKGAKVGETDPWHSTSLGKALLAELPSEECRELLERVGMPGFTSRTITDPQVLLIALERVRGDGFAVDDEESEEGLRCVGAAIHDAAGEARFALSVSAPGHRLTYADVAEVGPAVRDAAQRISTALGHRRDGDG